MKIRKANIDEISRIAELGRDFFQEAGWTDITNWRHATAEKSLTRMIENENSILLVAVEENEIIGMAAAFVTDIWFSEEKLAQELFWYIKPESRGGVGSKLLQELELKVKEKGADIIAMIGLDKTKSLNDYYLRKGYRASEHSFIKRL